MNATESVTLCRYVQACCPQQAMDEMTPMAWADLLENIRYDDARQAAKHIAQRQPFVAPAEIITEVRRIRAKRIADHGDPVPPAGLDPKAELEWRRQAWEAIGNGDQVPGRGIQHELQGQREQAYAIGGAA